MTNTATRGSPAPTYHDSKAHVIRHLVVFDVVGELEKNCFFSGIAHITSFPPSPPIRATCTTFLNAKIGDLTSIQKMKLQSNMAKVQNICICE